MTWRPVTPLTLREQERAAYMAGGTALAAQLGEVIDALQDVPETARQAAETLDREIGEECLARLRMLVRDGASDEYLLDEIRAAEARLFAVASGVSDDLYYAGAGSARLANE